jgi:ABC-type nitrate/sulfonate/bicarbonate transport system, permease component
MGRVRVHPPLINTTDSGGEGEPLAEHPPDATAEQRGTGRALSPRVTRFVLGGAGVLTLLAVLEILPRTGLVNPRFTPPLSTVLRALFTELIPGNAFWSSVGNTLLTWAIGLGVVIVSGLITGVLVGAIPLLRTLTTTTVEFLRPIPSVALIPLAIALFGIDRSATLLLVIYASFWQVFIQVQYGVRDVDPVARDTARVYHFRRGTLVSKVIWPTMLPYAMTGFRLAAAVALILTITGELIIGSDGIGRLIVAAQNAANYPQMYGLIIVTGLLGLAVNLVARRMEQRLLRWHPSTRLEAV